MFKWPLVFDLWTTYLTKFVGRYGGDKLERARDLFEQVRVLEGVETPNISLKTVHVHIELLRC